MTPGAVPGRAFYRGWMGQFGILPWTVEELTLTEAVEVARHKKQGVTLAT